MAASLADQYLKKQHCYDDMYKFSGIICMFMQRCVVGGRVMTANNEKIIIQESDNCSVDDFDEVSLYPSNGTVTWFRKRKTKSTRRLNNGISKNM